jgi:hypothetical protein
MSNTELENKNLMFKCHHLILIYEGTEAMALETSWNINFILTFVHQIFSETTCNQATTSPCITEP